MQAEDEPLPQGEIIINDTFRLEDKLGEGGPSIVYRGTDLIMNIPVAIKLLKDEASEGLNSTQRFLREARTQAKLVHQHIVTIRTISKHEGRYYIIMEFVDGHTLEDRIHVSQTQPCLPYHEVTRIGRQVLDGLGFAHSKDVLHRDIKPANIMLTKEGEAKLADFGIAKEIHDNRLTQTGAVLGTPAFMSPEQIRGGSIDHRADIYSFGATLYMAICGHTPFENPSFDSPDLFEMMRRHMMEAPIPLHMLGVDIPPKLDMAIIKSLAKSPEERFASCEDFANTLQDSLDNGPIIVPPSSEDHTPSVSPSQPTKAFKQLVVSVLAKWQSLSRQTQIYVILGTIVACSLALNVFFLTRSRPTPTPARRPTQLVTKQPTPKSRQVTPPQKQPIAIPDAAPPMFPDEPAPEPIKPEKTLVDKTKQPSGSSASPPQTTHKELPTTVKGASDMVKIPGGCFLQGQNEPHSRHSKSHAPQRKVCLKTYWIDAFETSVDAYQKCLRAGRCNPIYKYRFLRGRIDIVRQLKPEEAMSYVRWQDAAKYCEWAGKTLPTEAEWEKAARGTKANLYPWGNKPPSCLQARFGYCRTRNSRIGKGIRSAGRSPYGVFDMTGNVWEWVQDCHVKQAYSQLLNQDPVMRKRRCRRHVVRGGGRYTKRDEQLTTFYRGRPGNPRARRSDYGFRCVWRAHKPNSSLKPN